MANKAEEEFINQKLEFCCDDCKVITQVLVYRAWLEPFLCSKCGKELLIGREKEDVLNQKMDLATACLFRALHASIDPKEQSHTRQIIVDLNCALEIRIKQMIVHQLKLESGNEDLRGFILDNFKMFDRMRRLIKVLKFKTPEEIERRLNGIRDLRNKVVHQGYAPSIQEARQAILEVSKIIHGIKTPPLREPSRSVVETLAARKKSVNSVMDLFQVVETQGTAAGF